MTIWADADSLPREARALIGRRAGASLGGEPLRAVFVANRAVPLPPGKSLEAVIVGRAGAPPRPEAGAEATASADEYILAAAAEGDIIITRDIPLAAKALAKGLVAINDRGTVWTAETVRERASLRDRMAELRNLGLAPASPQGKTYGPREAKAFADALDKAIRTALSSRA